MRIGHSQPGMYASDAHFSDFKLWGKLTLGVIQDNDAQG